MKLASAEKLLEIYYSGPEIGSDELMGILGCKQSAAQKRKKEIRKEMAKVGVKTALPYNVNTEIAFEFLGIDIKKVEAKHKKKQGLELAGL